MDFLGIVLVKSKILTNFLVLQELKALLLVIIHDIEMSLLFFHMITWSFIPAPMKDYKTCKVLC